MLCPIKARLLEGAPLNMNEFLFFHRPSSTLIGYILKLKSLATYCGEHLRHIYTVCVDLSWALNVS